VTRRDFILSTAVLSAVSSSADPVPEITVTFDASFPGRPIRALHGVNGGPLAAGGLLDLSARWKDAAFPLARLHDSHWPNPDVVDVHAVFPDPAADGPSIAQFVPRGTGHSARVANVVGRLCRCFRHHYCLTEATPAAAQMSGGAW
jgi:hypothetical protein